jgi:cytochrome c oxidase assembly factor CtaG
MAAEPWRLEVASPLALAMMVYTVGWARLARRSPSGLRARLVGRLALALGGLVVAAIALLGLQDAAHERFLPHMVQHVLLMMVAVPALLLADPLPALLWALPSTARASLRALLIGPARTRRAWRALTRLPVAWTLWAVVLGLWHVPAAHDAALEILWVHDLAHLTLAAAAVVFWWPVIGPAPRSAVPPAVSRVVYLLLAAFASAALGVLLATSPQPLYAYRAPPSGLNLLEDQVAGGLVMWAVGGAIDMAAVLALVARAVGGDRRPRCPAARVIGRGEAS